MANQVEDVFRCTAQFDDSVANTKYQTVWYGQLVVGVDFSDTAIIADWQEIIADLMDEIDGLQPATVTGDFLEIVNVTRRERVGKPNLTYAGTAVAGEMLPPQCAAELLFPLKAQGRTGRKYLFGFQENNQSGGVWEAAALTALGNFANLAVALFNALTSTNEWRLGIARFAGINLQDFTSYEDTTPRVKSVVHTQRRRTSGFGLT